jgi:hypothetical protein
MGIFLGVVVGCCIIAAVLWYWLRLIARGIAATGAVLEATVNRAAKIRGDNPVSDDIDMRRVFNEK